MPEQDAEHPTIPRRSIWRRLLNAASVLIAGAALAGLTAGGVATLHLRAEAEAARPLSPPVSVATVRVSMVDGYERTTRFTGRLEPRRQTALAFERGGLVVEVVPQEGSRVLAGAVIARLDTSALRAGRRQLEARRRELEAQRNLADLTLGRQSRLSAQGWTPGQRLDEAEATLAQLTAAIEQVSAQIAGIDIDLAKSELKAPFDGRIAARSIDEGAVVAAGTPVATLLESGRQQARIGLPPGIAQDLDAGATHALRIGETTLRAAVASRRPDLDTATRTMTVLFDVVDPPQNVMFGDLVTLELGTRVEERGAWLPLAALKEGQRGLWSVLVVDAGAEVAIVRPEAVEVLHVEGSRVFVRGALRDGDHILSGGADRVVAGQRVALARN